MCARVDQLSGPGFVTRHDKNLPRLGELVQKLEAPPPSPGIPVHEGLVDEYGEALAVVVEMAHDRQAYCQIELFSCPGREIFRRHGRCCITLARPSHVEFTGVAHQDAVVSVTRNGSEVTGCPTDDVGLMFLTEATVRLTNGVCEDDFSVVLSL